VPAWAIVLTVYGGSAPLALAFAWRSGFLPRGDPILAFRLPAVLWVGPLVALVAALSALGAIAAHLLGARRTGEALAWWRRLEP
jgi:hypothetical protein